MISLVVLIAATRDSEVVVDVVTDSDLVFLVALVVPSVRSADTGLSFVIESVRPSCVVSSVASAVTLEASTDGTLTAVELFLSLEIGLPAATSAAGLTVQAQSIQKSTIKSVGTSVQSFR